MSWKFKHHVSFFSAAQSIVRSASNVAIPSAQRIKATLNCKIKNSRVHFFYFFVQPFVIVAATDRLRCGFRALFKKRLQWECVCVCCCCCFILIAWNYDSVLAKTFNYVRSHTLVWLWFTIENGSVALIGCCWFAKYCCCRA